MPGIRLTWVVLAWWVVVIPPFALAQERREFPLGAEEAPVTVFADRIDNLERERLLTAEGNVEIEQGPVRLQADRVEVSTETGEAVAAGRVVFFDGQDRLTGSRLEYNFRTGTGVIFEAEGFAAPHFFFAGTRMERLGEKAYRVRGGTFTTCEADSPAWRVKLGLATAYLDDWVWGTNASFWVWKIPLIPYVPIFAAPLGRERQSGLLAPRFATSDEKGFSVAQPIYWAISDSQDLTLVPTWYEKRGFGLGALYRYVRRETSRGELEGFVLDDTRTDDTRWVVGLRHDEEITPRLTLRADLAQVSDDRYFAEFGDTLDDRSRQRLESNLALTQRWDTWNLVARLFFYEDLTTEEDVELQRLPDIRLNAFQQPVPGLPGLLYELETSYVNFVRDVGVGGQRLDLRPRLSYPFSPGGLLTLTPRVAGRATVYDRSVTTTTLDDGSVVEGTESELIARTLVEAGLDAEARAYRVFDTGGAFGIARVQHAIEPRVSYNYVSDPSREDVPLFDGIDAIRGANIVTYSLTNRVKARAVGRTVGGQEVPGRVWELLRFTLSQTYNLDSDVPREARFSDVLADLIVQPTYGMWFRGSMSLDTDDGRISTATTDIWYQASDWRVTFGTRHGDGGDLSFIQGTIAARLGARWAVRFSTNYNVDTGDVIENRFELDFREQCWAVTLAFVDRTDEDEFRVTVNLLELGHYGFGRVFASQ